jgi:hypothetical protein
MQTLLHDIRYGIRMLAKNPGFTVVAVLTLTLTLALGIGANTALFSVVNGVLLNPLPYPEPEQLVALYANRVQIPRASISYPNFLDWQRQNSTFVSMAAFRNDDFNLTGTGTGTGTGEAEHVRGEMVSADFFSTLGVQPKIGRWFSSQEDQLGAAPVAVLSAALWTRKFGARPDIVGRSVALNGTAYSIIGVAPAGFQMELQTSPQKPELYVCSAEIAAARRRWPRRHFCEPIARLTGGAEKRLFPRGSSRWLPICTAPNSGAFQ